jgi:hypothetical protein
MKREKASSAFLMEVERLGVLEDFFGFFLRDSGIGFYFHVKDMD